jgi:hypothetical protein
MGAQWTGPRGDAPPHCALAYPRDPQAIPTHAGGRNCIPARGGRRCTGRPTTPGGSSGRPDPYTDPTYLYAPAETDILTSCIYGRHDVMQATSRYQISSGEVKPCICQG